MAANSNLHVLAVAGSLRKGSYHRQLLTALPDLSPGALEIEVFDLEGIPLFNADVEDKGYPERVQSFRQSIESSDGIIWATPEYNGSMSGVIKNAVDWASRKGLLAKRPTTVISGSTGALGATKGQEALRSSLNHLGMYVMAKPSLAIPQIDKKLSDGQITDETTKKFVKEWLEAFKDWIVQLAK